ncbi:MAG: hypothetical protein IT176_11520 [Acidobacteria bacterium]|nr:hypothetical protein [Acidobacteriota bacterium]
MFCDEVLDAVERIAAGEETPDRRAADHLATCRQCAAALADARAIDVLLRARPAPRVPAQFTSRTMARVRGDRWRRERVLDAGFNLALGLILFGLASVVWMLLNGSGLASVGDDAVAVFRTAGVALARRVAPALPLYAGAALLLGGALAFWWWAERDAAA